MLFLDVCYKLILKITQNSSCDFAVLNIAVNRVICGFVSCDVTMFLNLTSFRYFCFVNMVLLRGNNATINIHVKTPARTLHSSDTNLLSVPRVRTCFGSRSFSVAAPTIWNSLPFDTRNNCSIASFRRKLKTFFFSTSSHV